MAFWGQEVKFGKGAVFVPPPEQGTLRLTQATLSLSAIGQERVALSCKLGKDDVLICALREGGTESMNLDIVLDQYAEFAIESSEPKSKASIHLAGYHVPDETHSHEEDIKEEDDEGVEFDEEDLSAAGLDPSALARMPPALLQRLIQLKALRDSGELEGGSDSEEDDDFGSDEEDSEMDYDEEVPRRQPSVIIEELVDDEGTNPEAPNGTAKTVQETKAVIQPLENGVSAVTTTVEQTTTTNTAKDQVKSKKDLASDKGSKKKALEYAIDEEDSSEEEDIDSDELEELGIDDLDADESDEEEEEEDNLKEEVKAQVANGKRKAEEVKKQAKKAQKAAKAIESKGATDANSSLLEPAQKKAKAESSKKNEEAKPLTTPVQTAQTPAVTPLKGIKKHPNGFTIENVSMGDPAGKLAKGGKKVVVKYVGRLAKNNKVFDQTKGNKTFTFRLGVGEVIKGWDQGVQGMRVGDKRKLTVPPQMAYGNKGVKDAIPGNATLMFDVELVDVKG